jgi:hypothetical protein
VCVRQEFLDGIATRWAVHVDCGLTGHTDADGGDKGESSVDEAVDVVHLNEAGGGWKGGGK